MTDELSDSRPVPAELLELLLEEHPEAHVAALRDDGLLVHPPASVRLRGQTIMTGSSMLEAFRRQDWPLVLALWDTVLTDGVGRVTVHLATHPGVLVTVYVLDARPQHGVLMGLYHPAAPDASGPDLPEADPEPDVVLPPRFGRVRKDLRAVLTHVDEDTGRMLGRSASELVGLRTSELVHPDDLELAVGSWMQMLTQPGLARRVPLRHAHSDGRWIWLEVTNHNLLEDPEHGYVVADLVDISRERAAQEMVRARQELLDRLTETVPVGLLQLDLDGTVVYTNPRLHEVVGRPPAATAAEQLAGLIAQDVPRWEGALTEILEHGGAAELELHFEGATSADPAPDTGSTLAGPWRTRICHTALRPLRDEQGRVSGLIACLSDTTQSVRLREQLHTRATYDSLTGSLNRAAAMNRLEDLLRTSGPESGTALAYCDLDEFKQINDQHGHAAGDVVLREVAARLASFLRAGQFSGRLGGDEFLLVCPDVAGHTQAEALGTRLERHLSKPAALSPGGQQVPLHVTVGVSWSQAGTADELIAQADAAMYQRKRRRRQQTTR